MKVVGQEIHAKARKKISDSVHLYLTSNELTDLAQINMKSVSDDIITNFKGSKAAFELVHSDQNYIKHVIKLAHVKMIRGSIDKLLTDFLTHGDYHTLSPKDCRAHVNSYFVHHKDKGAFIKLNFREYINTSALRITENLMNDEDSLSEADEKDTIDIETDSCED